MNQISVTVPRPKTSPPANSCVTRENRHSTQRISSGKLVMLALIKRIDHPERLAIRLSNRTRTRTGTSNRKNPAVFQSPHD